MTFVRDGYLINDSVLSTEECDRFLELLGDSGNSAVGSRCLLDKDWCRELGSRLRRWLTADLPFVREALLVQCTYFRKTPDSNWLVAWHQDRSIPVSAKTPSPELTGWSQKEGITFVHAPEAVLNEMFAVRVHLDESASENGPLRVIPGTHRHGTLAPPQIKEIGAEKAGVECLVGRGGILVMRPLLLHASSKAIVAQPRRVLHFVFGPSELPAGLEWRYGF